ncbi:Flowering time control protein FCA-like protein [Drosera capensis]
MKRGGDDRKEEPHPHQPNFHGNAGFHGDGGFGGGELRYWRNDGPAAGDGRFGDGAFGRGRGFSRAPFPRKRNFSSFECPDGSDVAKLFVGGIARTTTEEEIRRVFEKYGDIIEVVMVQDKKTSKQQEYCFVKYFSMDAADRAIAAVNNELIFPGGTAPVRVRYADGERERAAASVVQHKLYVNGLNKQASNEEVREIFASYGLVEDVYLLFDDCKQRRGCGFITFSHREMAVAAINGLHGTYVMKGCDQPLIVRFADPKKPRIRELREAPDSRDFHGGTALGILGAPPYENATINGAEPPTPFANPIKSPSSSMVHQLIHQQTALNLNHGNIVQPGDTRMACDQTPESTSKHQMVPVTSVDTNGAAISFQSPSPAVAICDSVEDDPDCEWSEHVCPDGYKYYFNCVTYESRWEKPEEYSMYEEQLHKSEQQFRNLPDTQVQQLPQSDAPSDEQSSLMQAMECESGCSQPENGLKLMSCAEEHNLQNFTTDTDRDISPAFVQQSGSPLFNPNLDSEDSTNLMLSTGMHI